MEKSKNRDWGGEGEGYFVVVWTFSKKNINFWRSKTSLIAIGETKVIKGVGLYARARNSRHSGIQNSQHVWSIERQKL